MQCLRKLAHDVDRNGTVCPFYVAQIGTTDSRIVRKLFLGNVLQTAQCTQIAGKSLSALKKGFG